MINAVLVMLVLGGVMGLLLGISSKIFHVEPDHRAQDLLALLPGYNCGGCGFPGCQGMADALAEGSADVASCKPSKPDAREAIKQYLAEHPAN
ncbi:MAG: electron transporter RnfB [Solobacterium sp.]|nr:electron transporter RnfB [Solobacterium sp.]